MKKENKWNACEENVEKNDFRVSDVLFSLTDGLNMLDYQTTLQEVR